MVWCYLVIIRTIHFTKRGHRYLPNITFCVCFPSYNCNKYDANLYIHNFHIQIQRPALHPSHDSILSPGLHCLSAPCHIKAAGLLLIMSCGTIESIFVSSGWDNDWQATGWHHQFSFTDWHLHGWHTQKILILSAPQTQNMKDELPGTFYVYILSLRRAG